MRESFSRVDDALIDRLFQPLADWMDCHMALGTGHAARLCIDAACLAWISAQLGAASAAMASQDMRMLTVHGAVVVLGLWAFAILRNVFQKSDGEARARLRAQANPLRPGMQLHRAACLVWMAGLAVKTLAAPFDGASLALLAVGVFATAAVYIGACTNPPPAWRTVRDTRRNLAFGIGRV